MTERRVHFVRSCPYLTIVGGTTEYDPEVAAPLSGGGFSDYFPRPVYQDVTVSAFLEHQGAQYAGLNNPEGCGIPDIATQALKLIIFLRNVRIGVEGTSSSTPTVAGVFSLLNDYLITNSRPPLGFLNIRQYNGIRASTTSYLALTLAVAAMDFLPSQDGIPFVPPDLYLFAFKVG
ncbi:peptidase S8/S53 domain-containing protein [Lactarius sanguifluus]|nr:peptidase S8/S53 domain-containing protein [Lactarius sanguifluus]